MTIRIVREPITLDEMRSLAHGQFGDFVKAVMDVQLGVMTIAGELHADEEALFLEQGSRQADLWGSTSIQTGWERIVSSSTP